MWGRLLVVMLVIEFSGGGLTMAQAPIRPIQPGFAAPRSPKSVSSGTGASASPVIPEHPLFQFPTTPEVSLKLKSGSGRPVRGKLITLSDHHVVVETTTSTRRERDDVGQTIGFDRIESLRSIDGRFEFKPEEDFQVVSKRIVAAYASVQIEQDPDPIASRPGVGNGTPAPATNENPATPGTASSRPKPGKPSANGLGNGGFGGINNLQKPKKPASGTISTDPTTEEQTVETTTEIANPTSVAPTSGVTEIFLCSNCTKEIPASAVKSGVCPHCQIAFANVTVAPRPSTTNPFQKTEGPSASAFAPTSPTTPTAASTPSQSTGTQIIHGGSGFSIDAVPNWAKGGLFVLLVLIGWHLMFNR